MLNSNNGKEAILHYLANDYEVIKPGQFVTCAVTGKTIPLQDLKYWSAALQEPFIDAHAAEVRYRETGEI